MTSLRGRLLPHLLVAFLLSTPSLAMDDVPEDEPSEAEEPAKADDAGKGPAEPAKPADAEELTEKERRDASKREQAERRAEERAGKEAEAEAAVDDAERARREKLGVSAEGTIPEDDKGFFVRLEAFWADISGADRTVARVSDIVTSASAAEDLDTDAAGFPGSGLPDAFSTTNVQPLTLSYDGKVSAELEVGWRFARRAALSARYWSISQSSSLDRSSSQVFPSNAGGAALRLGGIDNQGIENEFGTYDQNPGPFDRPFGSPFLVVSNRLHGADRIVASGEFEASRFDLLYTKAGLARKRVELFYRTGLSMAEVDRRESATLTWTSFSQAQVGLNAQSIEAIAASCSTSGVGAMVGMAGRFDFTEDRRWGVRVGLDVAGIFSKHELTFRDSSLFTQDGLPAQPEQVFHDTRAAGGSHLLTILDGEVAFEGRFRRIQVSLGYAKSKWLSALTEERYPSAANTAQLDQRVLDLDFSGPFVRLGFYF